jgi:D-methionine transport system permease protein
MTTLFIQAFWESCLMIGSASLISLIIGLPLGVALNMLSDRGLRPRRACYKGISFLVSSVRSIPYIILTVLLIPITRALVGSSIGTWAAVVPLSLAGTLLLGRAVEESLWQIPIEKIEFGKAAGATNWQIIRFILLPEALPSLISNGTTVVIALIGLSAMAGVVGGGGLGDLAIRYGYQRYNFEFLFVIVISLIMMVHTTQEIGNFLVKKTTK